MTGATPDNVINPCGDAQVVHGADLDISDGGFRVFVGPSGCGR